MGRPADWMDRRAAHTFGRMENQVEISGVRGAPRPRRSGRLRSVLGPFLCLSLLGVVPAGAAADRVPPNLAGYPNSIAAAGDSITRAYNAGFWPYVDSPNRSWSTGADARVDGHYLRILSAEPAVSGRRYNVAVSGAKVADLADQVAEVNAASVAYVTILIGANDLCTRTVATMTPVSTFEARFEAAIDELSSGSPRARIYVVSIPSVYRLWEVFKDDPLARTVWRTFGVCRSMLANPRSTAPADTERRQKVQERNVAFNEVLGEVCDAYIHCRYDGDAVFGTRFGPSDVSRRDYFHPSRAGQAKLARVSWEAGFDFTDGSPPTSVSMTEELPGATLVELSATDDVGVSGIEYRLNRGPWQRYSSALLLQGGSELRFRAVDVNGNSESTNVVVV